jgi:hypothetical protein
MLKISDANNFRRTLTGICLIAAPLVLLIFNLIGLTMEMPEDTGARLAAFAAQPDRVLVLTLLFALAHLLFLPAVFGLVSLVRDRGVTLVHIGAMLAVIGLFGHTVFSGSQLVVVQMAEGAADQGQMIALYNRFLESPGFIIFALMGLAGFFLGFIILPIGLWRAGVVPGWMAALIILSLMLEFIATNFIDYASIVASVLFTLGFAVIGLNMLTMSDEEWGRTNSELFGERTPVQQTVPVQ